MYFIMGWNKVGKHVNVANIVYKVVCKVMIHSGWVCNYDIIRRRLRQWH